MTPITLAVPSKGRLEEQTRDWFASKGMRITRPGGARSYLGAIDGNDAVTVRFYPAAEIARELIRGNIDLGVTGLDLIHETSEQGPDSVAVAAELGFGQADVVVAIPDSWIDVTHMHDLADVASDFRARHGRWLRVATKYITVTRAHFAQAGIAEYRTVESLGATEAAPAAGVADLVVDITSTGSTLAANGLRVLQDGVMLRSQACLFATRQADAAQSVAIAQFLDDLGVSKEGDEKRA
jgi:ATP phosphoribosyltransferase